MNKNERIYKMSFASVYPLYVQKAEKKGRTKEEVDEIIQWLTGYSAEQLQQTIDARTSFEMVLRTGAAYESGRGADQRRGVRRAR